MSIERSKTDSALREDWRLEPFHVPVRGKKTSVLDGLRGILKGSVNELILEAKTIRLVSPDEAFKFWRNWWAQEQKSPAKEK